MREMRWRGVLAGEPALLRRPAQRPAVMTMGLFDVKLKEGEVGIAMFMMEYHRMCLVNVTVP